MLKLYSYVDDTLNSANQISEADKGCLPFHADSQFPGFRHVPMTDLEKETRLGLPIYQDASGYALAPMTHSFIFGGTGTGKSTVIFENDIHYFSHLSPARRPSMLITDLKGEITPLYYHALQDLGYRVFVLDMCNPMRSSSYNFLTSVYDDYQEAMDLKKKVTEGKIKTKFRGETFPSKKAAISYATFLYRDLLDKMEKKICQMAEIMIVSDDPKNASWFEGARNCLISVILATLTDSRMPNSKVNRNNFTVTSIISTILSNCSKDFDDIADWLKRAAAWEENEILISDRIRMALQVYCCEARITRDGFMSSLVQPLQKYFSISVSILTQTETTLNLREMARSANQPTAIFVITDDTDSVTTSLSTLLVNELANELTKAADGTPSHSLPRPFVFLLDEFANMPAFPIITSLVTTGRSRNIWVHMAIQSIEQVNSKYGQEKERILWDNTGKIFLGINSNETKQRISEEMGMKTVTEYSAHIDGEGTVSYSASNVQKPALSVNDLDSLQLGEFLVSIFRCQKIKSSMIPYFARQDIDRSREGYAPAVRTLSAEENIYKGPQEMRNQEDEAAEDVARSAHNLSEFLSRMDRKNRYSGKHDAES